MRILSLDLGRHTGWATLVDGRRTSGVQHFLVGRHSGAGMEFLNFRKWLSDLHQAAGEFDRVYYEEVRRHLGTDAAHVYGAFWGTLTAWCQSHNVPFEGVPVGTIKRFASGKGNASKEQMVASVARRFGRDVDELDQNEADAIALIEYVRAEYVPAEREPAAIKTKD